MEKKKFVILLVVLLEVLEVVTTKDTETSHFHQKKPIRKKNKFHRHHARQLNTKCWPQRCNIICPIQIQPFPSNQNILSNSVPASTPASSIKFTQESLSTTFPRTTRGLTTSISSSPKPNGNLPQLNDISQNFDKGLSQLLDRLNHLSNRQKHHLVKHIKLGNRNGKKAFKFRQFAPFGCYVQCEESGQLSPGQQLPGDLSPGPQLPAQLPPGQQLPGQLPPAEPVGGDQGDNEDEEEEDTPYQEGEDKPIEVTVSPPDRSKLFLNSFEGGPSIFLEDKKKQKSKSHVNNPEKPIKHQ